MKQPTLVLTHCSLRRAAVVGFAAFILLGTGQAQTGHVEWDKPVGKDFEEPAWFDQGFVFVGNWEPLNFRLRKGWHNGPLTVEVEEDYRREHREETVLKLKAAGVNFVMTHFFKTGLVSDLQSIEDTYAFVKLCHVHGIRVGAYVGGTIFAETMLRDFPEAEEWVRWDEHGEANRYGAATYRLRPDFNHPGYKAYIRTVLELAVQQAEVDLIHLDNFSMLPPPRTGFTDEINRRFRDFLTRKYTRDERELRFGYGFSDLKGMTVPTWHGVGNGSGLSPIADPLIQEWVDFRCSDLAEYYGEMGDFIRDLNPEVLVELNPHGIFGSNRAFMHGVDHARLLPHGSAFWSEEPNEAHIDEGGVLVSKIRSFKLARALDQTMFSYTGMQRANLQLRSYRLLMAESMAFNRNSLGDIGEPLDYEKWPEDLLHYVSFYHRHNDHYSAVQTVADVAIVRSFPSMAYNSLGPQLHTTLLEQMLIQYKIPFDIVFDQNLTDLSKYRAVILGDQESLSDRAVELLEAYVAAGGGLVATGRTSLFTEWRRRRHDLALAGVLGVHCEHDKPLPATRLGTCGSGRVAYVPEVESGLNLEDPNTARSIAKGGVKNRYWELPSNAAELIAAIRHAVGGSLSVEFTGAPLTTVMELLDKRDGSERILHWINYDLEHPASGTSVRLAVPEGKIVEEINLVSPDRGLEPGKVRFTEEENGVQFDLPELEVYQVAVLVLRDRN